MNNKKGFTLIELLAVIIILAILMIIAVPNILSTLATARGQAFLTQSQSIYKAAQQQYTIKSMQNKYITCFSNNPTISSAESTAGITVDDKKLDLGSISSSVSYRVEINNSKIVFISVSDSGQNLSITKGTAGGSSEVKQNEITGTLAAATTITQCS